LLFGLKAEGNESLDRLPLCCRTGASTLQRYLWAILPRFNPVIRSRANKLGNSKPAY